ncbi:MAG: hypothetical protein M1835_002733 [Candelina submexicana]|nr:MAG: hypothetical protein M1835_002733 [Candelina submexicana]
MEYPPTPSKGFTASPEPIEQLHESVQDFAVIDNDATPRPLKIDKRTVSATPTPIRRKPVPNALPLRQGSAVVESPQYARNTAIEPVRVPARQSSTTFAQKMLAAENQKVAGEASNRGRSTSSASNLSRSESPIPQPEALAIKKHRHTRTVSDTSSISSNGDYRNAQQKFLDENPPLNSGTTFYGPLRFDTDTSYEYPDDWPFRSEPLQGVKQRAATTGTYLNTKPASPLSPLSPLNPVEPPEAFTSLGQALSTDEAVPAPQDFGRTRENRSKSLGTQGPFPQRTSSRSAKTISKLFTDWSQDMNKTFKELNPEIKPEPKVLTRLSQKLQNAKNALLKGGPLPESRATSASSVYSEASTSSHEKDKSLFPVPPSGATPSKTVHTVEITSPSPQRKTLSEDAKALNVRLKVIPEVDSIDVSQGRSIWVAVEAEGVISTKATQGSPLHENGRIDGVVIIDNTSFTSHRAFTSSRELAIIIASLLDPKRDRLAILATTHQYSEGEIGGAYVVSPLKTFSVLKIKNLVDTIHKPDPEDKPDRNALNNALRVATGLLLHPGWEAARSAGQGMVSGHIFVISANITGSRLKGTDHFKVHTIHPGYVPWKGNTEFSNGWQLRSMYPQLFESTALCQEQGGLRDHLTSLIHHARSGTDPGEAEELEFRIRPAKYCEVEAILGNTVVSTLRPGQVATIFIKLKVGQQVIDDPEDPFLSASPRTPTELFEELDTMLGQAVVNLFSVEVIFINKLLASGTECTTVAPAQVKRTTPKSKRNPEWSNIHPLLRTPERSPNGSLTSPLVDVQKRLAFWLAGNMEPRKAIMAIERMCSQLGEGKTTGSERFVAQVIEELEHQKKVMCRWNFNLGRDKFVFDLQVFSRHALSPTSVDLKTPTSVATQAYKKMTPHGILKTPVSYGVLGTPTRKNTLADERSERMLMRVSGGSGSGGASERLMMASRQPSGQKVPGDVGQPSGEKVSGGAARQIWKTMRKDSQGEQRADIVYARHVNRVNVDYNRFACGGGGSGRHVSGGEGALGIGGLTGHGREAVPRNEYEELEALPIKEQALRNKRSIGADTLKSMRDGGRGGGKGVSAPWLI